MVVVKESDRVVLNIGGQLFETYVDTLRRYPRSLLGAMFSERNAALLKPDEKSQYFFDRTSDAFPVILDFYRVGRIIPKPSVSAEALHAELEFWGLSAYVEAENSSARNDEEEDFTGFGAELAKIVKQKARERNQKFYPLLKRQIRQALLHAAEQGMATCEVYFSNRGHTYFGSDADGNPLYEIRNEACSEFFGVDANQIMLMNDLSRMGLVVETIPTRPGARVGLRFHLWRHEPDVQIAAKLAAEEELHSLLARVTLPHPTTQA